MNLFEVQHLQAGYGSKSIVSDLSFSTRAGHITGILGANGCGKTTLLKAICGIIASEGECILDGIPLRKLNAKQLAKQVSYIPQRSGITIDISVLDVVLMGFNPHLGLLEYPSREMQETALEALHTVGLSARAQDNYLHLSEGQKQLCILARTLVSTGKLLLLDEPESALDFRYRYMLLTILRRWVKKEPRCAIVTLHDPSLALNACDELLLLKNGQRIGMIHPHDDPLPAMAMQLEEIYGAVTVTSCRDRTGKQRLVMLKEEENCF